MSCKWIILASAAVGGAACVAAAIYFYRKKKFSTTEFVCIGKVSHLTIYPVKSMKGVSVDEMDCEEIGPKHKERRDRHFMIMDAATGKHVTGRQFPKLLTISADVYGGTLFLTSGHRIFELNLEEVVRRQDIKRVELYDGLKQEGLDCGNQICEFIRLILETTESLRLLYRVDNLYTERDVVPKPEWLISPVPERVDPLAFSDDCPYMALCDSSLDDLNSRLPEDAQVDMRWFRPVIQISGPPPYNEDMWYELKINDVTFSCYKPCVRCVMTTINPDTGIRREDSQPLKCLREYRLAPGKLRETYKQSPIFGINMGVINKGTIQVGDPVYARYKPHPY